MLLLKMDTEHIHLVQQRLHLVERDTKCTASNFNNNNINSYKRC